jgi:serine/threonine protein kinase
MTTYSSIKFIDWLRSKRIVDEVRLDLFWESHPELHLDSRLKGCLETLALEGLLTAYQIELIQTQRSAGLFAPPYIILDVLGRGGMGRVFLAEHRVLRRRVALKVVSAELKDQTGFLERLYREGKAVAQLDHPNIVRVYDILETKSLVAIVMEHVEGVNLVELTSRSGAIHTSMASWYIAQAAAGLEHAHARGLVHRDIKPENMLLNRSGQIKLVDFGLTRTFDAEDDAITRKFTPNQIVGTLDFMSPEQLLGKAPHPAQDWYSLGATFFFLLTGCPPFRGTTQDKIAQHKVDHNPFVQELDRFVPGTLACIVRKLLAHDPDERLCSGPELVEQLKLWLPANSREILFRNPTDSGVFEHSPTIPFRASNSMQDKDLPSSTVSDSDVIGWPEQPPVIPLKARLLRFSLIPISMLLIGIGVTLGWFTVHSAAVRTDEPSTEGIVFQTTFEAFKGYQGIVSKEITNPQQGPAPQIPHMQLLTWQPNTQFEYDFPSINGAVCLALKSLTDEVAINLTIPALPIELTPNADYRVELDYQLQGALPANARFVVKTEDSEQHWSHRFDRTYDRWETARLDLFKVRGSKLELAITDQSPKMEHPRLHIRSLRVYEVKHLSPRPGRVIKQFLFGKSAKSSKQRFENGQSTLTQGDLPTGWKLGDLIQQTMEIEVRDEDDNSEMMIAYLDGKEVGGYVHPSFVNLQRAGYYTLTLEGNYRPAMGDEGFMVYLQGESTQYEIYDYHLPTNGKWRKILVRFYAEPGALKVGFGIKNGTLRVRRISLEAD